MAGSSAGGLALSTNERFTTGLVCFCDIPVEDFPIHIAKYGPFGIAWDKSYLVARGASPVFYVARDSVAAVQPATSRAKYFDAMARLWDKFINAKSENPITTELAALS